MEQTMTGSFSLQLGHLKLEAFPSIDDAWARANLFANREDQATLRIHDAQNRFVALATCRRIMGEMDKQRWGGRKGDYAESVGVDEFDATNKILGMPLQDIQALQDCESESDEIGLSFIEWSGPFSVTIVDSILAFFGVDSLDDITEEASAFARTKYMTESGGQEQILNVNLKLSVKLHEPLMLDEIKQALQLDVSLGCAGHVKIKEQEIS